MPRIYLAGPEVFLPNAVELGVQKKEICRQHGFEGLFPLDREPPGVAADGPGLGMEIFGICIDMMTECDLMIANLTPFRGVSMDVGTAVEIGFVHALGKPIFGYTNVVESYEARVRYALEAEGEEIEAFDLVDNLMVEGPIRRSGGTVVRHPARLEERLTDLTGFEACVRQARG